MCVCVCVCVCVANSGDCGSSQMLTWWAPFTQDAEKRFASKFVCKNPTLPFTTISSIDLECVTLLHLPDLDLECVTLMHLPGLHLEVPGRKLEIPQRRGVRHVTPDVRLGCVHRLKEETVRVKSQQERFQCYSCTHTHTREREREGRWEKQLTT